MSPVGSPLQGLIHFPWADPGRCPGLEWRCPVGAREQATSKALTGRPNRKVRAFFPTCPNWNARRSELRFSKAPTGRHHPSPGQRPGFRITPPIPAPTGRPNRNGGDTRSPSMNGRFGIDATVGSPLQGSIHFPWADPGRCPGLEWHCPVEAREQASPKPQRGGLTGRCGPFMQHYRNVTHGVTNCVFPSPNGAASPQPRATPRVPDHPTHSSPKGAA